jgi:protoheme IX farnesyltransferase
MEVIAPARSVDVLAKARDVVALAKPRVTLLVLLTTAAGAWLAPGPMTRAAWLALLAGVALVVAGANALNMLLERDTDALMERTRNRPLAAGRLSPSAGLAVGLVATCASLPILAAFTNFTTTLLALLANLLYVLAYTPLKRRSPLALFVGAVPGAIPPVLGWTARSGRVDGAALALFALLYAWQIPHFLSIAAFRRSEYEGAGLRAASAPSAAKVAQAFIVALGGISALLVPLHVARPAYLAVALPLGLGFLVVARRDPGRPTLLASLVYLTALSVALAVTK